MNFTSLLRVLCLLLIPIAVSCSRNKRVSKKQPQHSAQTSTADNSIKEKYARELGVNPTDIKNTSLYKFIDDWNGVPYKYGGTTKSGIDCSGFIGQLYKDVYQQTLPRSTGEIDKACSKVPKSSLKEGDLVFFDISNKKSSHIGVYLQNEKFVHASSSKGVIISDLQNPYYQKTFASGGRR